MKTGKKLKKKKKIKVPLKNMNNQVKNTRILNQKKKRMNNLIENVQFLLFQQVLLT